MEVEVGASSAGVGWGNGILQESLHQKSQNARAEGVLKFVISPPLPGLPLKSFSLDFYREMSAFSPALQITPPPVPAFAGRATSK